jgi:2-oxoglutarate dehydrogenase E2 component (dihydrolipoamide succinyltransferase)
LCKPFFLCTKQKKKLFGIKKRYHQLSNTTMAQFELIMPKMGESIMEATILKWVKQEGDVVELDETVVEIATDKVDSEVPSPVAGTITKILFAENDTVAIGKTIALIDTSAGAVAGGNGAQPAAAPVKVEAAETPVSSPTPQAAVQASHAAPSAKSDAGRFYSPLVRNIAKEENIAVQELDSIAGTGMHGRVTKKDILDYLQNRSHTPSAPAANLVPARPNFAPPAVSSEGNVEIVEMDRMRRLIADHMVMSKQVSPHVTSFVEVDVTNLVQWRDQVKDEFQQKHREKITFTPIFIEAVAKAIGDFPMVNVSVDGTKIIVKKDINIGMAAALPSGNLIVPVIKNADQLNLVGLSKAVNDLAGRARNNQLKPEEIQGGTFTLTNVGTFGNVMGTPIINQPQVAILAVGAIRKKPAVVETEYGDLIAIRQMMFMSLSYDHRVVDGFLGGSFLRRIADYLEAFNPKREV